MLVNFGQANLLEKARQQPERVKQVIDKMKTDGIKPTLEAVFRKLDTPLPLGYSQAGEVIAVGKGVTEFQVGDRVISNGHHAEVRSRSQKPGSQNTGRRQLRGSRFYRGRGDRPAGHSAH
ncbi:MAG: alcohol dehydrogenase catalytic domain-containing protein [Balneolaceae bacterium]|nr:alcohol dehydrogenase catalytic domain-containing protein [Balneolaceae bacterium]